MSLSLSVQYINLTRYGGKVYSLTDVPTGRSLVHSPAIHQPVVAAKLDAQVDGGIEWNWSPGQLGHWAGACTLSFFSMCIVPT